MAEKKRSHHKKKDPSPVNHKPVAKKKIPRQEALPGMENTKITAIENAAMDYAEIRDERQELTLREVELKTKLLDLMHKAGKTEYKRNGISVKIVPEGENVKVRVKSEDDLPTDITPAPGPNVSAESLAVNSEA